MGTDRGEPCRYSLEVTHNMPRTRKSAGHLVEASPDSFLVIDASGTIQRADGDAASMLGRSPRDMVGLGLGDVLDGESAERALSKLPELLDTGPSAPALVIERITALRGDGTELAVEAVLVVLDDHDGDSILVTLRDDRHAVASHRAESKARERLQSSNRDLEAFASVAAHDLQEPLRKIRFFAERAKTSFLAGDPDSGSDSLDRMDAAVIRMQALISDLLGLARIAGQEPARDTVDLTELVTMLKDELLALHGESARVEVGKIPDVAADPVRMHQLFHNLIENALKFHKPDQPAEVTVSGERRGGWVEVTVDDNGVGFDEKYADRIFRPFERLHGRDAYEGTGIGLPLARAIAERHGGSLSAHGRPGAGATFTVILPAADTR